MKMMKSMLAALVLCAGMAHAATETWWQVRQVVKWNGRTFEVVVATYQSREEAACHAWALACQGSLVRITETQFDR